MTERQFAGKQFPIDRVKCVVDSCKYNDERSHCIASTIEIQPPNARDTQETDCATFRPKG
ncbi:MAG: DUF1540 domain-containing protein [Bacillota bacterium]